MLVPAQLCRDEISRELTARWYIPRFSHYFSGNREEVRIADNAHWRRDFAYEDMHHRLGGYFSYAYNESARSMSNFGLVGFQKNNIAFLREVKAHILHMIVTGQAHRIEFWAFTDNPVMKLYRRWAEQYGGVEIATLHRVAFYEGAYHDMSVFEFLREDILSHITVLPEVCYE